MKILIGYSYYKYPVDIKEWFESIIIRLRNAGFDVDPFPLTINPPGPRLSWQSLERRWKFGDRELLEMYENLAIKLEDYDVFINYNGINLHPDFVKQLSTFNVYCCFDDPESSEDLSKPVAAYYDLCMIGNIAEVETYKKWGVKNAKFWPHGFKPDDFDPLLTKEKILSGERDIDVTLLCERTSGWRGERLDKYSSAFPNGSYYGLGWPLGFLEESTRIPLYQRTKIGPNFHNSTGPINFRTFVLPANGVLQICDNKSHLGEIFALNKEVIGFDTIEEAIDLTRYYLEHDNERREIAAAGWERAVTEYNEISVFQKMIDAINETLYVKEECDSRIFIQNKFQKTKVKRIIYNELKFLKNKIFNNK